MAFRRCLVHVGKKRYSLFAHLGDSSYWSRTTSQLDGDFINQHATGNTLDASCNDRQYSVLLDHCKFLFMFALRSQLLALTLSGSTECGTEVYLQRNWNEQGAFQDGYSGIAPNDI